MNVELQRALAERNGDANTLEHDFVQQVYDEIAPHFSDTRYRPWPVVKDYLDALPTGSCVADVGCGNGKYMDVNKGVVTLGSDWSLNLLKICLQRGFEVLQCNNLSLPYRSDVFDNVISIAVLHHLSTPERRLAALKELLRILKAKGTALIFVWAMEQESKQFDAQDTFVAWKLASHYTTPSTSAPAAPAGSASTATAPAGDQGPVFQRYYHLFVKGELEQLVKKTRMAEIVKSGYDRDNWYVVVRKIYCEP